jgi:hypothetical protein
MQINYHNPEPKYPKPKRSMSIFFSLQISDTSNSEHEQEQRQKTCKLSDLAKLELEVIDEKIERLTRLSNEAKQEMKEAIEK